MRENDAATTIDSLSVVAPAYNEADSIGALATHWLDYLRARPGLCSFEIIVCDDGSTDATAAILAHLAEAHAELRIVQHARNRGGGCAVASAVAASRYRWVLILDADGQFPIENLDRFAEALHAEPALAFLGARTDKQDSGFGRFGARVTTLACNAIYGSSYQDLSSACQLVHGELVRSLRIEAKGLNYSVEIASKLLESGVRIREVPIVHRTRVGGRSSRTLLKSSVHRAMWVGYLAIRRALIAASILDSALGDRGTIAGAGAAGTGTGTGAR